MLENRIEPLGNEAKSSEKTEPETIPSDAERREKWSTKLEFFIILVGFAVGLGNVWRFPNYMFLHGGGAFLVPYFVSMFAMGMPLFCLEIMYGQISGLGPISMWSVRPIFKGLGIAMVNLSALISVYYNIVVATAMYFMFASFQDPLPWSKCSNSWNTCGCRSSGEEEETAVTGLNCTHNSDKRNLASSTHEYYYNHVLDRTDGIQTPGKIKWNITLCNLIAWVIIAIALSRGIRSMGKAGYFFTLVPYASLTFLVVRGVTLKGSLKGLAFYLKPHASKLFDTDVWMAAASQIFFSLSCCTGSLTAMSSYNNVQNNFVRDSVIIPFINAFSSFYAGLAIFSVLGFMSERLGVDIDQVTKAGSGLVFVVYPEALSLMPVPQLWSVVFFLMMVCLGIGTQLPSVETVLTGLQDEFPYLRKQPNNSIFRITTCVFGFLLGLPFTTQGGSYLLDLTDNFVGWPLLFIGFFEVVALVWVYGKMFISFICLFGTTRLLNDVKFILGSRLNWWMIYKYFFFPGTVFATPVLVLVCSFL